MKVKFNPLNDRVLIETVMMSDKTASGLLYIPEVAQKRTQTGYVAAIGPNVETLRVDDVVIYDMYVGIELEDQGKKFLLVDERDVLATIDKDGGGVNE